MIWRIKIREEERESAIMKGEFWSIGRVSLVYELQKL